MTQKELEQLLGDMTLSEKIGQMTQLMGNFYEDDSSSVLTGPAGDLNISKEQLTYAGSVLSGYGAGELIRMQDAYLKSQPHRIPMLFMRDIIHGMKTIFPIPLAQGASFDPELTEKCAEATAKEAAVSGLHVTFAPMTDLVRDARWGRVMESTGEDPYLNSRMTEAAVRGFQGKDVKEPYRIAACLKHFAGYGAATAGRDYNAVEMGEHTLREYYLPSFQAGIDTGAKLVMTAFHTIDGVPCSVNRHLMKEILRDEMGFEGVLISDFGALGETVTHGYCADGTDAARKSLEAGVDIDMMSSVYPGSLRYLVKEEPEYMEMIDACVMRILQLKNALGLFENPYKDADPEEEKKIILCPSHRELARKASSASFVLLKNDGLLPLSEGKDGKKIAFIGPYVYSRQLNSSWAFTGDSRDCVSLKEAAEEIFPGEQTVYLQGCPMLGAEAAFLSGFGEEAKGALLTVTEEEKRNMLQNAVLAAKQADIVVLALGEHFLQSGEATSRAMIEIPEIQMEMFREIRRVNNRIVVILFNGRPLDLREISREAGAILEVWLPGTEGGHAVVDVLTGRVNPSGRLPMSFPYCVGQVPVFYNELRTGRPKIPGQSERFQSKYLDIPNEPLYPFGFGLSYTEFQISPVELSSQSMTPGGSIEARVTVKNIGHTEGTETLQMYLGDLSASVARPVKELKGFRKVTLSPGESREEEFQISEETLRFVRADGRFVSEPGTFRIWIGNSSQTENCAEFELRMNCRELC